jgi:hypothetical protein
MKCPFALILLLCLASAKSQSLPKEDSVDIYISRLGWQSFAVAWTYIPQLALRGDADRLIKIIDETKIKKLVNNLADSQKTVVIHLILTRLLEPDNYAFGVTYSYGKDSRVKGCVFKYNGLQWTTDSLQKNSISQEDIDKVKQYWRERLPKQPMITFGAIDGQYPQPGPSLLFQIDFQDFFKKDTISLKVDQCVVLADTPLTSDRSTGFTGVYIQAYALDDQHFKLIYNNRVIVCPGKANAISLNLWINKKEEDYIVDLSLGKYIGFSKQDNASKLSLNQRLTPYEYD